jgi:hypothetical protein
MIATAIAIAAVAIGLLSAWLMLADSVPAFVAPLCLYSAIALFVVSATILVLRGLGMLASRRAARRAAEAVAQVDLNGKLALCSGELSVLAKLIEVNAKDRLTRGELESDILSDYKKAMRPKAQKAYDNARAFGCDGTEMQNLIDNVASTDDMLNLSAALLNLSEKMKSVV